MARPLDTSLSSTDPNPKRSKTTSVTDKELGEPDECGGQDEDGDLRPILRRSCENEGDWQSRSLHKHSRSTCSRLAERGRQIDRFWPDHHCSETAGTKERHLRDDGVMEHYVTSKDRYITIVSTVAETAVVGSPGIRMPKCARW